MVKFWLMTMALLVTSGVAAPQPPDSVGDFCPLAEGNEWVYGGVERNLSDSSHVLLTFHVVTKQAFTSSTNWKVEIKQLRYRRWKAGVQLPDTLAVYTTDLFESGGTLPFTTDGMAKLMFGPHRYPKANTFSTTIGSTKYIMTRDYSSYEAQRYSNSEETVKLKDVGVYTYTEGGADEYMGASSITYYYLVRFNSLRFEADPTAIRSRKVSARGPDSRNLGFDRDVLGRLNPASGHVPAASLLIPR